MRDLWRRRVGGGRDRALCFLYLGACGALLAAAGIGPIRDRILDRVETGVERFERRWDRRLRHADALVSEKRYEEAARYLEGLDRRFPARNVRDARDRQREHLLHLLAGSYERLGRKRLALVTLGRAVAFDPRNWANHYLLAAAARRLDEPDLAQTQFRGVLEVHPTQLASLGAVIGDAYDRGDYAEVVERYTSYLDAFVIHELGVILGRDTATVRVRVDGRWKAVHASLPGAPRAGGDTLLLDSGPYGIEIERLELAREMPAGEPGRGLGALAPPEGVWRRAAMPPMEHIENSSGEPGTSGPGAGLGRHPLAIPLPPDSAPVTTIRIRLRLIKPIDRVTWERVEASYRDLLDPDGLASAAWRSLRAPPRSGAR
ncbi:MAG: tetratricopeptide repeat protein [Gemmatimonadota bacterium]